MADSLIRPPPAARKGRGFRTPMCQVEGCRADLTDSKAYYSRHKVCGPHSKSPQVIVNGLHQRFCQQCSRFHLLNEFDSEKRSCRRRLAGHNERRRKPPPGSLLHSRYPRLSGKKTYDAVLALRPTSRFDFPFSGSGPPSAGFPIELSSPYPQSTLWPRILVQGSDLGTPTRKPLSWQRIPQHPPYATFMPNSASLDLIGFAGHSEVCFTGVTAESSCALSLLSNQSWDLRNQASSSLSSCNVTAGAPAPTLHEPPPLKGPEPGEFEDPQKHRRQFQEQHQSVRLVRWSL